MNGDLEETGELRRLFQAQTSRAAGEDCPDADRIRSAALDRCPSREFRALLEHTVSCPACAAAWRLARDLGDREDGNVLDSRASGLRGQPGSMAPGSGRTASAWPWRSLGTAAAVLVAAVGIGLYLAPTPTVYRAPAENEIRCLVPEDRPLPRSAFVLRWSPSDEGTTYAIRLSTADFVSVTKAEGLEVAQYRVPAEVLDAFPSGTRFIWQIDAFLPGGRRTTSETFFVELE